MSDTTEIAWCDSTFNPWIGCTKVGPGCDHCYAEADFDLRRHRAKWGAGQPRHRTAPANWKKPIQWNAKPFAVCPLCGWRGEQAEAARGCDCPQCMTPNVLVSARRRVFCASLADVFDNEVPVQWRADLFALIAKTPNLDWLLLTKRIGNAKTMMADALSTCQAANREGMIWPLPNVWIGATICNQAEADRDIPKLLSVPAAVRFLSMEPLLGPVSLDCWPIYGEDEKPLLHWVIVGGESGSKARPMHPDWARGLRDQCAAAGVPFLFKQWGEWIPHGPIPGGNEARDLRNGIVQYMIGDGREFDGHFRRGDAAVRRVGKKAAGRLLDGVQHDGYPENLS